MDAVNLITPAETCTQIAYHIQILGSIEVPIEKTIQ